MKRNRELTTTYLLRPRVITDANIKQYVKMYLENYDELPDNLKVSIGDWDVSRVTNMKYLFMGYNLFNEPLNNWDVSNVTDMKAMFWNCESFNQPLDNWDVSNVTDMSSLFVQCSFNQPINSWNVSHVTNMSGMFIGCTSFNQLLDNWDVSHVTNMNSMFVGCTSFNQPLNNWDVSHVSNMSSMFEGCTSFNQPLNNWDVSNVTDMGGMFAGCTSFNQPLNNWDVSNVIDHEQIFFYCPITEENKPQFRHVREEVDMYQVHKAAAKVRWNALNTFLEEKNGKQRPITNTESFASYIKLAVYAIINENSLLTPAEKTAEKKGFNALFTHRLRGIDYSEKSPVLLNAVYNAIEYVKTQPPEFQKEYIHKYIYDCTNAYESFGHRTAGMSCPMGTLERFILALNDACALALSSSSTPNPEYEQIMGFLNPPQMDEVAKEWYKLHKTGTDTAFPEETTMEEKRKSLKDYLLQYFDDVEAIDAKIAEYEAAIGFDPDSFAYGGRSRKKTRKTCKTSRRVKKRRNTTTSRRTARKQTRRRKQHRVPN